MVAPHVGMNILSIQSWVAYGHVGNASAMFPLQRLGAEVWAVNTVQFSNHAGYPGWTGQMFTGQQVGDVIDGIGARGVLSRCDGVLSGYLGGSGVGEAVVDAVRQVKAANGAALYCCDPVIGDVGKGVYVRGGLPELLRDRALPCADILTPNQFELAFLSGMDCASRDGAKAAVAAVQARGPRTVLVTSLRTTETPDDAVDMMVAEDGAFHLLRTPLLAANFNGAGDAMAALFLVHRLRTGSAVAAMEAAGSSIFGVLRRTELAGSRELLLVSAQDEFVHPTQSFGAEPV
jgi:pyridoxine kinase